MSFLGRLSYVSRGTIANAIQALLFFRIGQPLVDLGTGQYAGPFSDMASMMASLWMLEIVVLQIALFAFWIYGGVREERSRGVEP